MRPLQYSIRIIPLIWVQTENVAIDSKTYYTSEPSSMIQGLKIILTGKTEYNNGSY